MPNLLKKYKGKFCTFYRKEDDGTNYGWIGTLLDFDRDYVKIKCTDGKIRLLNRHVLDIIIDGNWAMELEVKIDPNSKDKKNDSDTE